MFIHEGNEKPKQQDSGSTLIGQFFCPKNGVHLILHSNVTAHPTAAWTVSPLRCECVLACIPPAEEPNKFLAVVKLLGSSALMVAVGAVVYWVGKSRKKNA